LLKPANRHGTEKLPFTRAKRQTDYCDNAKFIIKSGLMIRQDLLIKGLLSKTASEL